MQRRVRLLTVLEVLCHGVKDAAWHVLLRHPEAVSKSAFNSLATLVLKDFKGLFRSIWHLQPDTAGSWHKQVRVEKMRRRKEGDVASAGITCHSFLHVSHVI